jgi:amino acid transporter
MDTSLESQLQNLIRLRSSEDQADWTIFSIFCATTAVLLVALLPNGKLPSSNTVGLVISIVGLGLSFVWMLIQRRGIAWIKYYEEIIEKLECELKIPSRFATSGKINDIAYEKHLGKGIHVRTLMMSVPLIITILWGLASLLFLINLICHCIR